MYIKLCSLFSGSSGNATYIGNDKTHILVDSGLSGIKVKTALKHIGVKPDSIGAIVITHEHTDHIQSAGVLSREFDIPIYANEKTWEQMEKRLGALSPKNMRLFYNDMDFYIDNINVSPFSIPHDAADPVGFCFYYRSSKISIATDLGYTNKKIIDKMKDSNVVLLEANHDIDMLANGPYPYHLKRRIRGTRGHLSNEDAGGVAVELAKGNVTHLLLAHLSEKNNAPNLAHETVSDYLRSNDIAIGEDIVLDMTYRDRAGNVYHIG
ncbi:MAG: MBL fold metallo-hydrolase [Clostridiales bacterium]|nr:MBL fold metallo-hydrolase [Clostridiales bacterium]